MDKYIGQIILISVFNNIQQYNIRKKNEYRYIVKTPKMDITNLHITKNNNFSKEILNINQHKTQNNIHFGGVLLQLHASPQKMYYYDHIL